MTDGIFERLPLMDSDKWYSHVLANQRFWTTRGKPSFWRLLRVDHPEQFDPFILVSMFVEAIQGLSGIEIRSLIKHVCNVSKWWKAVGSRQSGKESQEKRVTLAERVINFQRVSHCVVPNCVRLTFVFRPRIKSWPTIRMSKLLDQMLEIFQRHTIGWSGGSILFWVLITTNLWSMMVSNAARWRLMSKFFGGRKNKSGNGDKRRRWWTFPNVYFGFPSPLCLRFQGPLRKFGGGVEIHLLYLLSEFTIFDMKNQSKYQIRSECGSRFRPKTQAATSLIWCNSIDPKWSGIFETSLLWEGKNGKSMYASSHNIYPQWKIEALFGICCKNRESEGPFFQDPRPHSQSPAAAAAAILYTHVQEARQL